MDVRFGSHSIVLLTNPFSAIFKTLLETLVHYCIQGRKTLGYLHIGVSTILAYIGYNIYIYTHIHIPISGLL